jgi:hypothetical protein
MQFTKGDKYVLGTIVEDKRVKRKRAKDMPRKCTVFQDCKNFVVMDLKLYKEAFLKSDIKNGIVVLERVG